MTLELWMLFWTCVLGIAHLSASSFAYKGQEGNAYTVGARDDPVPPPVSPTFRPRTTELQRNLRNFCSPHPDGCMSWK